MVGITLIPGFGIVAKMAGMAGFGIVPPGFLRVATRSLMVLSVSSASVVKES
jgi:hypothetical protein